MIRRIKGFTLLELVVVMILTGIAVTLVYRAYIYISQTYSVYVDSRERILELGEFQTVFQGDLDAAEKADAGQNKISLLFDQKLIHYHFIDSMVVREQKSRLDTFQIGLQQHQFYYHENQAGGLTDVKLKLKYKDEDISLYFDRAFDVQSLFLNEGN